MPIHDVHPELVQEVADAVGANLTSDLVTKMTALLVHLNDKELGRIIRLVLTVSADNIERIDLQQASNAELSLAAIALKQNARLQHVSLGRSLVAAWWRHGVSPYTNEEMAIVNAASKSVNLTSLDLEVFPETLNGLVDTLASGSTLRTVSLSFFQLNDDAEVYRMLVAMLRALKQSASLKSLSLKRIGVYDPWTFAADASTGVFEEIGDFFATHTALEQFAISPHFFPYNPHLFPDNIEAQLARALDRNTSLQAAWFVESGMPKGMPLGQAVVQRNRDLKALCQTLSSICRPTLGAGFHGLEQLQFRVHLFSYFLPVHCVPADYLVDLGLIARKPPSSILVKRAAGDHEHLDVQPISSSTTDVEAPQGDAQRDPNRISDTAIAEQQYVHDAAASFDQGEEGKILAIEESLADASNHDDDQLMRGISASKADMQEKGAPLSGDGVVVLRLTNRSRSQEVRSSILSSPSLALPLQSVADAGCSHVLDFAGGALSLVPLTQQQTEEADIEIREYHIIALSEHVKHIREALKYICKKRRPQVNVPDVESLLKRRRHDEAEGSANLSPWPVSSETPHLLMQGDAQIQEEPLHEDDDEPVDVIPECMLGLRTDSSVGLPVNPYRIE